MTAENKSLFLRIGMVVAIAAVLAVVLLQFPRTPIEERFVMALAIVAGFGLALKFTDNWVWQVLSGVAVAVIVGITSALGIQTVTDTEVRDALMNRAVMLGIGFFTGWVLEMMMEGYSLFILRQPEPVEEKDEDDTVETPVAQVQPVVQGISDDSARYIALLYAIAVTGGEKSHLVALLPKEVDVKKALADIRGFMPKDIEAAFKATPKAVAQPAAQPTSAPATPAGVDAQKLGHLLTAIGGEAFAGYIIKMVPNAGPKVSVFKELSLVKPALEAAMVPYTERQAQKTASTTAATPSSNGTGEKVAAK